MCDLFCVNEGFKFWKGDVVLVDGGCVGLCELVFGL